MSQQVNLRNMLTASVFTTAALNSKTLYHMELLRQLVNGAVGGGINMPRLQKALQQLGYLTEQGDISSLARQHGYMSRNPNSQAIKLTGKGLVELTWQAAQWCEQNKGLYVARKEKACNVN